MYLFILPLIYKKIRRKDAKGKTKQFAIIRESFERPVIPSLSFVFIPTPPSFCLREEGGGRKKEIRPAEVPVLLIR